MNAIILSGGRGTRMGGIEKAFLELGDKTFIQRRLDLLAPMVGSIIVVTNEPGLYTGFGTIVVRDEEPGLGPLMGLYSGLQASDTELNVVTTIDTPLLRPALVRHLIDNAQGCDAVVPRWQGQVEPLCAVYARGCRGAIRAVMDKRRIVAFYPLVRVCFIAEEVIRGLDPCGISFLNVNTPGDLETVRAAWHALGEPDSAKE